MAIDRSKYASKRNGQSALKKKQQELENKLQIKRGNKFGIIRAKQGMNYFRLYPPHPDHEDYALPITTHFLKIETDEYKDGKPTGEKKIGPKPVFSGLIHSEVGKCIIDQYIKFAYKMIDDEFEDDDDKKKMKAKVTGRNGIKGNTKWMAYGDRRDKDGKVVESLSRIELSTMVINSMDSLAMGEDDADDVIETDINIFTDLDEGRILKVKHDKQNDIPQEKRKIDDYYKTSIDLKKVTPLTDEELETHSKLKPLAELYVNSYTTKDFELAMEGLKRFDEENEIGVFGHDEWLDICDELSELYPEPTLEEKQKNNDDIDEMFEGKAEKKEESTPARVTEEVEEVQEQEESTGPVNDLDVLNRDQLVELIKKEELPIRILSRYTEDDLREFIEEERGIAAASQPAAEEVAEEPVAEVAEEASEEPTRRKRRSLD